MGSREEDVSTSRVDETDGVSGRRQLGVMVDSVMLLRG